MHWHKSEKKAEKVKNRGWHSVKSGVLVFVLIILLKLWCFSIGYRIVDVWSGRGIRDLFWDRDIVII